MTLVKICGVNSADAFDAAVEAGADWVGFVFFAGSPRQVSPAAAALLSARHAGGPLRVGLFVAATDTEIELACAALRLDVLQLYDTPSRAAEIAARFGLPVWRSVHISETHDLPASAEGATALLIEPLPPAAATRPGGNAAVLNWSILCGWQPPFRWLLAGGLTPGNVAAAIAASGALAVDVSSGVESAPGVKCPERIRKFVNAVKEDVLF